MNTDIFRRNSQNWDIFTKKEEYQPELVDRHLRFPSYMSQYKDLLTPALSQVLIESGFEPTYPKAARFAVCLSHDIDVLYHSPFAMAYHFVTAMRTRDRNLLVSAAKSSLSKLSRSANPLWGFEETMELEKEHGARSTFFFMALEPGQPAFNYRLSDLTDEFAAIRAKGWEIALHGGDDAFENPVSLAREKQALERESGARVIGFRSHFLRQRIPLTWELLARAGFVYDSTFGDAYRVGFKNGMCHPFRPFNLSTQTYEDILELPLVVMDFTLDGYMQLGWDASWRLIKRLVDVVSRLRGVMTILWHNNYMANHSVAVYTKLLEYCGSQGAWLTSCGELAEWWEANRLCERESP